MHITFYSFLYVIFYFNLPHAYNEMKNFSVLKSVLFYVEIRL